MLVVGILYLNQWRAGLIDARVQSLRVQGEIIAAAIAASATVDSDVISVNPDRLLELQGDEHGLAAQLFRSERSNSRSIPSGSRRCCATSITPTRTRARIYDQGGLLILDSDNIYARGEVLRQIIEPAGSARLLPVRLVEHAAELGAGRRFPAIPGISASTKAPAIPRSRRR